MKQTEQTKTHQEVIRTHQEFTRNQPDTQSWKVTGELMR